MLEKIGSVYHFYLKRGNDWFFSEQILPTSGQGESGLGYGDRVGVSLNALAVGGPWNIANGTGSVFMYDVIEARCDVSTEEPSFLPTSPYPTYDATECR